MAGGKTLEALVQIAGSISPSLGKAADEATKKLSGMNVKALAIGAAAGGMAIAVGKAVVESGKYLADLGSQFDAAEDAIRIGTGATGDDLGALVESFEAVYSSVPTSMEAASQAISDYNTRLGVTGDELETLSAQALQVSDMLGDDLGTVVETSSQAFQQWGIEADGMSDAMDYIFKVSQSTGVGFSDLMSSLQSYGAALQQYGYSFEEAGALLGQVEKAGYDVSAVFAGLKTGAANLADEGFATLSEGIDFYIDAIKNAETDTEALSIAADVFGSRAATTMVAAIQDGTLSVEELQAAMESSTETINTAAQDTYDYAEMLQILKQKGEVALKPLADSVFQMINKLMPVLTTAMDALIPVIDNLSTTLIPIVEDIVPSILPLLTDMIPPIMEIAGALASELIPPIVEIMKDLLPVALQVIRMLMPIISVIASTILPAVLNVIQALLPIFTEIIGAVLPVITRLLEKVLPIIGELVDAFLPVILSILEALLPVLTPLLEAILSIVDALWPLIELCLELISGVLSVLGPILSEVAGIIGKVLVIAVEALVVAINWIVEAIINVIDWFKEFGKNVGKIFKSAWKAVTKAWESAATWFKSKIIDPIVKFFTGLWDKITGAASAAWNGVKKVWSAVSSWFSKNVTEPVGKFFSKAWDGIKSAASTAWDGVKSAWNGAGSWISKNVTGPIGSFFSSAWDTVKSTASTAWGALKTGASTAWSNVKSAWSSAGSWFSTTWGTVKSAASTAWDNIKSGASTAWSNTKSAWSTAGSWATTTWGSIKTAASSAWDNVSSTASRIFGNVKTTIKGAIDYVKGLFNFSWSLPNIKLPHFKINGGKWPYGLGGQGTFPSISISWYKEGGILDGAQIFGAAGGNLLGGGEAGQEAVLPLKTLWDKMGGLLRSVLSENEGQTYTAQAGRLVELDDFSLSELSSNSSTVIYYDFSGFTWSPTVEGSGDGNEGGILAKLKAHEAEFFDWLEEFIAAREAGSYVTG